MAYPLLSVARSAHQFDGAFNAAGVVEVRAT